MSASFDPMDADFRRDPHTQLARSRRSARIVPHPGPPRTFSLLHYEDVRGILRDWKLWSNEITPDETSREFGALIADPPAHDRMRGLLERAFRPRMIADLEERVREIANALMDDVVASKRVDFVESFAYPLPVIVIAEILGVPPEDRKLFKSWSDEAFSTLGLGLFGGVTDSIQARHRALVSEMCGYFEPLVADRRAKPRDDLLTAMVEAEYEGSSLDFDEVVRSLVLLLVAGNETTTSVIANAALAFDSFPSERQRLYREPERVEQAVEEVLRFSTPVLYDPRRATRDTELHGVSVREGDVVLAWLSSANRDEAIFEEPERFDIRRERNPHLTFGLGIHHCLGAHLARLELRIALETLFSRTRDFERVDDAPLPLHPSPVFGSVSQLPIQVVEAGGS